MKKILLEIKHSINKRIGNAIESISCRLYYHSKKNSWGHCLYAMKKNSDKTSAILYIK